MSAELTPELCVDVAAELGLPHPGLVEKDHYVVRALGALACVKHGDHRLVFGGGTALARAHCWIQRMSEDIDLRIHPPIENNKERSAFRKKIGEALADVGFDFDPKNRDEFVKVHDAGKTFVYTLPYAALTEGVATLRPGVKVEVSSWPLLLTGVELPVRSFVAEASQGGPEVKSILCVDPTETAADKFVALTRRIAGERGIDVSKRDPTLLRHAYDLHQIRPRIDFNSAVGMIGGIMESDRRTRGGKDAAYSEDALGSSKAAIDILRNDEAYADSYAAFVRDMVYGAKTTLADCLPTLEEFASHLT